MVSFFFHNPPHALLSNVGVEFIKKKHHDVKNTCNLGPVCLLESSFLLESEFRESELFSDVW